MKTRVLPFEEWYRLAGTEAAGMENYRGPADTKVLVVEEDGEIIGTWSLLRIVQAECLWIAPKYRGSFGVAKRLLAGMREIAREWGAGWVLTGSLSDHVTDIIMRLGGTPMPCMSFILPAAERSRSREAVCQSQP